MYDSVTRVTTNCVLVIVAIALVMVVVTYDLPSTQQHDHQSLKRISIQEKRAETKNRPALKSTFEQNIPDESSKFVNLLVNKQRREEPNRRDNRNRPNERETPKDADKPKKEMQMENTIDYAFPKPRAKERDSLRYGKDTKPAGNNADNRRNVFKSRPVISKTPIPTRKGDAKDGKGKLNPIKFESKPQNKPEQMLAEFKAFETTTHPETTRTYSVRRGHYTTSSFGSVENDQEINASSKFNKHEQNVKHLNSAERSMLPWSGHGETYKNTLSKMGKHVEHIKQDREVERGLKSQRMVVETANRGLTTSAKLPLETTTGISRPTTSSPHKEASAQKHDNDVLEVHKTDMNTSNKINIANQLPATYGHQAGDENADVNINKPNKDSETLVNVELKENTKINREMNNSRSDNSSRTLDAQELNDNLFDSVLSNISRSNTTKMRNSVSDINVLENLEMGRHKFNTYRLDNYASDQNSKLDIFVDHLNTIVSETNESKSRSFESEILKRPGLVPAVISNENFASEMETLNTQQVNKSIDHEPNTMDSKIHVFERVSMSVSRNDTIGNRQFEKGDKTKYSDAIEIVKQEHVNKLSNGSKIVTIKDVNSESMDTSRSNHDGEKRPQHNNKPMSIDGLSVIPSREHDSPISQLTQPSEDATPVIRPSHEINPVIRPSHDDITVVIPPDDDFQGSSLPKETPTKFRTPKDNSQVIEPPRIDSSEIMPPKHDSQGSRPSKNDLPLIQSPKENIPIAGSTKNAVPVVRPSSDENRINKQHKDSTSELLPSENKRFKIRLPIDGTSGSVSSKDDSKLLQTPNDEKTVARQTKDNTELPRKDKSNSRSDVITPETKDRSKTNEHAAAKKEQLKTADKDGTKAQPMKITTPNSTKEATPSNQQPADDKTMPKSDVSTTTKHAPQGKSGDDKTSQDNADLTKRGQRKLELLGRTDMMSGNRSCSKKLPEVIIIGVMKAGTEAFSTFLAINPQIAMSLNVRSTLFFTSAYDKGIKWYREQMLCSTKDQVTVEKAPQYYPHALAPERIHRMNPNIKLILMVRDPIDRAVSHYLQVQKAHPNEVNGKSFEQMVFRADGSVQTDSKYIALSRYYGILKRWLKYFKLNQILIVDGDDFKVNQIRSLAVAERFIGVSHYITEDKFAFNKEKGFYCIRTGDGEEDYSCLGGGKGRTHPPISDANYKKLKNYFEPYNKQFYNLVGKNFKW